MLKNVNMLHHVLLHRFRLLAQTCLNGITQACDERSIITFGIFFINSCTIDNKVDSLVQQYQFTLKISIKHECTIISNETTKDRSETMLNTYQLYSKKKIGILSLFDAIVNVGLVLFIGVFHSVGNEYSNNNEQSHRCKNTNSYH